MNGHGAVAGECVLDSGASAESIRQCASLGAKAHVDSRSELYQ